MKATPIALVLFCLFLFVNSNSANADEKKNVCSITINSSEEINLFKKAFNPSQWNFIELTQIDDGSALKSTSNWFKNSCEKKIQCDILVLSGHFAGRFFGHDSGFSLTMEEIEMNSCSQDCGGIIHRPKEIFLFGCNTLAGKERDHRTPQEYMNVLLEDGFTQEQASQVVAYRYSDLGLSFKGRMSQAFSSVPRLYGFSGVAPSGVTVEPLLKSYLNQSKEDYANFDQYNRNLKTSQNLKLFKALQSTAIAQASGLNAIDPNYDKSLRPYCYLADEKRTVEDRLGYIRNALFSGRALAVIPYILKFASELKNKNYVFSPAEQNILDDIRQSHVREDFERILTLNEDMYLKIRVDTVTLMLDLKFIDENLYRSKILKILNLDFSKPFSRERVDAICSADARIENLEIPDLYLEEDAIQVIRCLRPSNPQAHMRIAKILEDDSEPGEVKRAAVLTLGQLKPMDPKIHMMIANFMKNSNDDQLRSFAAETLGEIKPADLKIQLMIAELMNADPNQTVREYAAAALRKIKEAR
jgi:hypothetical protein